jgi:hypothetical protein
MADCPATYGIWAVWVKVSEPGMAGRPLFADKERSVNVVVTVTVTVLFVADAGEVAVAETVMPSLTEVESSPSYKIRRERRFARSSGV